MEEPTTVQQVRQLYELNLISIDDCAYIFNIQPMSVHAKFQRLKKGKLIRTFLWPGEKKRLIERLEKPINAINEVLETQNVN